MNLDELLKGFKMVSDYFESLVDERIEEYSQDEVKKQFPVPHYALNELNWKAMAAAVSDIPPFSDSESDFYKKTLFSAITVKVIPEQENHLRLLCGGSNTAIVLKKMIQVGSEFIGYSEALYGNTVPLQSSIYELILDTLSEEKSRFIDTNSFIEDISVIANTVASEGVLISNKIRAYILTQKIVDGEFSIAVDTSTLLNVPIEDLIPIHIQFDLNKNQVTLPPLEI